MQYDGSRHVLNNPTSPPKVGATDEDYFGARGMIPLTGLADLAATPAGTVTVPGGFTGTIAETQALVDALLALIDADRTAFNSMKELLRKNT